jgi:hypothetical protein
MSLVRGGTRQIVRGAVALALAVALGMGAGDSARAAYGDGFGIAPPLGPALPGASSFWAGTCSRADAAAIGAEIPSDGVGTRNPTMLVKANNGQYLNPSQPGVVDELPSPTTPSHCIDYGAAVQGWPAWADLPLGGPVEGAPQWRLPSLAEAGARPDGSATFTFDREPDRFFTSGSVDNVSVDLPAGLVGNPRAVPQCSGEQFDANPVQCPAESQVGVAEIALRNEVNFSVQSVVYPVYNLQPRKGKTAELGIPDINDFTTVRIVAKARTNGDFGVTTFVPQIPAALDLFSQTVTLWGVPWSASNDKWRLEQGTDVYNVGGIPHSGLAPADQVPYQESWGVIRPLISNPTECTGSGLQTRLSTDAYQRPGAFTAEGDPDLTDPDWKVALADAPPVTECDAPAFEPDVALTPTASGADAPTGLDVELSVPQNDDPPTSTPENTDLAHDPDDETGAPAFWRSEAGRATAQLDRAVVTLPEGVSVNPSGAAGLAGCSDAQIGLRQLGNPPLFDNQDPFDGVGPVECPAGSRIGTVEVDTPLLEEPLLGVVVLGMPKSTDPTSGQMFRMFIVVRSEERGLLAKIYGSAVADPATGRLTATFDKNPRVPFEQMRLRLKGGERALLANPQTCGLPGWAATFTPWTAAHGAGGQAADRDGAFAIGGDCSLGFDPALRAGMSTRQAGGEGTFSLGFSREDGEQWLRGVSVKLPTGLLASVGDVPLCSDAQAAAGTCPAVSRVGTVDAGAGSGAPFFLERKGDAYLTEGYKGAPYGLMVKVPVEAGPFRGQFALKPVVVRQALHVDRSTAQVTAVSDPFPQVWHGIPLRVRRVTVSVDRRSFMRNPTDCTPKQVQATLVSAKGASANRTAAFQVGGCARLGFKPKLGIRLTGRKQTRTLGHPGVRAIYSQGEGQAGTKRVEARLPKALALDPDNAQALCEFVDGTKPDLENHCPKGSIVGRARATSPLLRGPLVGNVYFVKNVRIDPVTGSPRRTLPMIVVALRGEIAINVRGESNVKGGRLVSVFRDLPDAPLSRFNLNIAGGRDGILVVTDSIRGPLNICRGRQTARVDIDAHNGRRHDLDVTAKTPCKKHKSVKRKRNKRRR